MDERILKEWNDLPQEKKECMTHYLNQAQLLFQSMLHEGALSSQEQIAMLCAITTGILAAFTHEPEVFNKIVSLAQSFDGRTYADFQFNFNGGSTYKH